MLRDSQMDERRNSHDVENNGLETPVESRFLVKQNFAKRITLVVLSFLLLGLLIFVYTHHYFIAVAMTIFLVLTVTCFTVCYHLPKVRRARERETGRITRPTSFRQSQSHRSRSRHRRRGSATSNRSALTLSRTPLRSPLPSPRHLTVAQSHSLLFIPSEGRLSRRDSPRRHSTGRRSPSPRNFTRHSARDRYSRSTECVNRDRPPEYHMVAAVSAQLPVKPPAHCHDLESPPSYEMVMQHRDLFPQSKH